jgi:outer membrane protein
MALALPALAQAPAPQTAPPPKPEAPPAAQTAPPKSTPPSGATSTKIAIIQFQAAVVTTQEGQQAQAALKAKFDPRKSQLEKKQADLQAIQDKLRKGGATLAADLRSKLESDLAAGTRSLNNDAEDLNGEVQEEVGKVMQSMAGKMGDIIRNYATQNGYTIVLDVSSQQTPVLWATPTVNITEAIVKLYDQAHPAKAGAAPAPGSNPPATSAPKPPAGTTAPPATKKQ